MSSVSAVVVGHNERRFCQVTLQSLERATVFARAAGITVDVAFVLDRPDAITRTLFEAQRHLANHVLHVDTGDPAVARNAGIAATAGDFVALLDGDDIWDEHWLVDCMQYLASQPAKTIAHPAFNLFFGDEDRLFAHVSQNSDAFDIDLIRLENYWDNICVAPRQAYASVPFKASDLKNGFAYEDWLWNCDTLAAGFTHEVVPETVVFKRSRPGSYNKQAQNRGAVVHNNPTSLYDWPRYKKS